MEVQEDSGAGGFLVEEIVSAGGKGRSNIGRADFLEAILLSTSIVSFLFAVEILGEHSSWHDPLIMVSTCGFCFLQLGFFFM
jgi:uncharacterized membrane protein YhaH (DUF805 family)